MKHLLWAALAALITSGCAGPTYSTRHGLDIYDHTKHQLSAANIEAVTDEALAMMGSEADLDDVRIYFYSKLIEVPMGPGQVVIADGYTDRVTETLIVSSFSDCLPATALIHELAHVLRERSGQDADPNHQDTAFWGRIEGLESRLKAKLCDEKSQIEEEIARRNPERPTQYARQAGR